MSVFKNPIMKEAIGAAISLGSYVLI